VILAYLTSVYARSSDTFVRAEVLALRERGHRVHTFSIREPSPDQVVSDEVRAERATTTDLLPTHKWSILMASLVCLITSPARSLSALVLAWRTARPGLRGRLLGIVYWSEAAFLAKRMKALGVQHLHNHLGESSATVAMLASAHSGIPFSVAIHGPYIFRAPEAWTLGTKIERASFTTCITEFTRSQCMIYAPHAAWTKLVTVRCGPDARFLAGDIPPYPKAKRLVWVGRVCEEKGVPLLIDAALALAEAGEDFELVLLGDGPLRETLEGRVRAAGHSDRVIFKGWASSDEVKAAIVASRAMVLPSFAEGLPVVIMEALALGRPVISTFIAGIPELVESGADGWIVPAGSVDALIAAMRAALALEDAELLRLGQEGRRRVRERHLLGDQIDILESSIAASVNG
jgi:colanic acid/amylovoran biosynthesis glycosyltransferase